MKNNKKGFTLIELLAVIVILALIMGIALTAMSGVINDSKANAARRTAASLIGGVRQRLILDGQVPNGCYTFDNTILQSGGTSSPFDGVDWKYDNATSDGTNNNKHIGSAIHDGKVKGVYSIACDSSEITNCSGASASYVKAEKDATTGKETYTICLTTGEPSYTYIYGTETDMEQDKDDVVKKASSTS